MAASVPAHKVSNIDFLAHAFRKLAKDEVFWVTSMPGDPHTAPRNLWGGREAPPLPTFVQPNHNNYVAVSSFIRGKDGMYHRRKDNHSRMHLVMVDDIGTKVHESKVVLKPSVMVETSPGNYQAWYFLDPPEPDADKADRCIKGMIQAGLTADATDPGMRGVTRYGRLPVGINGKLKYVEKLGSAFVQRVTVWAPELTYRIEEIAEAYGVDLMQSSPKQVNHNRHSRPEYVSAGGDDEMLEMLTQTGSYLGACDGLPGAHRIVCPWVFEHTDDDPSGTVYFEPSDNNAGSGGFKCHHGHCQDRSISHLRSFLRQMKTISKENT